MLGGLVLAVLAVLTMSFNPNHVACSGVCVHETLLGIILQYLLS